MLSYIKSLRPVPPSHFYQAAVQRIAIHRFCCLFVFIILYATSENCHVLAHRGTASENCHVQAHRGTETGGGAVSDAVTARQCRRSVFVAHVAAAAMVT